MTSRWGKAAAAVRGASLGLALVGLPARTFADRSVRLLDLEFDRSLEEVPAGERSRIPSCGEEDSRPAEGLAKAWRFAPEDQEDPDREPFAVAGTAVSQGGRRRLFSLVGWRGRGGIRVSLVDVTGGAPRSYRHLELGDPDPEPVGMVVDGTRLMVLDRTEGLAGYDLAGFEPVATGDAGELAGLRVPRLTAGPGRVDLARALGEASGAPVRFHACSMPRRRGEDRLVTAATLEAAGEGTAGPPALVRLDRWQLDPMGWPSMDGGMEFEPAGGDRLPLALLPLEDEDPPVVLGLSPGTPSRLLAWRVGSKAGAAGEWPWPEGAAGLHLSATRRLWGVSARRGRRLLFHAPVDAYLRVMRR